MKVKENINCIKCKHYYITWDSKFPRGCKAYGFKCVEFPSAMVYRSTGERCISFTLKK